jgi:DNA-directed RNA polymerase specialized sigma24 family protein
VKPDQIFRKLEEADWGTISIILLSHAVRIAGHLRWRGMSGVSGEDGELVKGVSCQDVVQELIEKTINGSRNWNPDEADLIPWLVQQLKSEINHLVETAAHAHERAELDDVSTMPSDMPSTLASSTSFYSQDPAQILLTQEEQQEKINALYDAASGSPDLEELLMALLDGCEPKPRYIAEELNRDVKDVNNSIRKLRRHIFR